MLNDLKWCIFGGLFDFLYLERVSSRRTLAALYQRHESVILGGFQYGSRRELISKLDATKLTSVLLFLVDQRAYRGRGFASLDFLILMQTVSDLRKVRRTLLMLPARGQRSRSNANSTRRTRLRAIVRIMRFMGFGRANAGSVLGEGAKKKKLNAKMRAKKVVRTSVKKGPVRRSKDSKKSVWA